MSPPSSPQGTLAPAERGAAEPEPVGGLLPQVWAGLFRQQQQLLDFGKVEGRSPCLSVGPQQLSCLSAGLWWLFRGADGKLYVVLSTPLRKPDSL